MRLTALAAILALGMLIGLSEDKATAYPPGLPRGGSGVRVANVTTNVTFTFNSEVGKVRTADPPANFDEKGNVKKYTKAELLKLKGDDPKEKKLTGYKADFSEIKMGDYVQVTISMLKGGPTKPAKKDADKKNADADADKPAKDDKVAGKSAKTGKWVVTNQLAGKVTKVDTANTDSDAKMTIQVTTQVLQGKTGGGGGYQKQTQTFDEEKYAATLIVIAKRSAEKPAK